MGCGERDNQKLTILVSDPKHAHEFPMDYLARVKKVHAEGGYGSQGYVSWTWLLSCEQMTRTLAKLISHSSVGCSIYVKEKSNDTVDTLQV